MLNKKEKFFDLSLDLLCTTTADYRYEYVNPAWEPLLGWTTEELRSRNFLDFVHPDDLNSAAAQAAAMSANVEKTASIEARFRHKDGHYVWISWAATINDGCFYAVGRDTTEEKRQAAALSAALAELKHFAYAASHDLREPLRTITSHLDIIDDNEQLSDESRVSLEYITDAATRMGAMLQGLLEFSRIDSSVEACSRVSLAALLERVAIHFPLLAVTANSLPVFQGIDSHLERLFQNILANAVRYRHSERPPTLKVSAEVESDSVTLRFRDNGVGIRAGQEERALEIFGRCHARSKFPDGQGVGLALCKRIAERHGGTIRLVNNEDGVGLTVVVQLQNSTRSQTNGRSNSRRLTD